MNILDHIRNIICKKCNNSYYINRINSLSAAMATTIHTVGIPKSSYIVRPDDFIPGVITADIEYFAYTEDEWINILTRIHTTNSLHYTKSVMDCDDFALIYSASIARSAQISELELQPAFGIAWSETHAFNIFITTKKEIKIYDPQMGKIIRNISDDYKYTKIWFMG